MNYEIVSLEQKEIIGIFVRTSNKSPNMKAEIGALWQRFYGENMISRIPFQVGECSYGLYTNYENDVSGSYDAVVGCEVEKIEETPEGFMSAVIPAGQYAKFSIVTDMQGDGVGKAWEEIWKEDLKRAYTVDFEEYLPGTDLSKTVVNIYLALV